MDIQRFFISITIVLSMISLPSYAIAQTKPNIILVMADDQGYGQVGYYDHPILRTPNINEMALGSLQLDRFYAGAPNCSPTRATVLTGRTNDRTAVIDHGYALRRQETTIAQLVQSQGYKTAHFGKWHLSGLQGPGAPVLASDTRHPGHFGFDRWISVSNFFDVNPLMCDQGTVKEYEGSSSDVIVRQALSYISENKDGPFLVVIWFGSPHSPWKALEGDKTNFPADMDDEEKNYLGEIEEMDKSIGRLRHALRELGIAGNTLVWYNSDNGGLPKGGKEGVKGLRGFKNTMYEGGLRVPCLIEWPDVIEPGRKSDYPACTMDILPTIAEILAIPEVDLPGPLDGLSLLPLFRENLKRREKAIPFRHRKRAALVDNDYKLIQPDLEKAEYELYNLKFDPAETTNIIDSEPKQAAVLIKALNQYSQSIENSLAGKDFDGGLNESDGGRMFWWDREDYKPFLKKWKERPEYAKALQDF